MARKTSKIPSAWPPILAGTRISLALVCLVSILVQLAQSLERPSFNPANFFSFFTIQSNILAAAILLTLGIAYFSGQADRKSIAWLRGAGTLYMTTTGIVYVLLLSGLEASLQTPIPWVNTVLHYLMPAAMLADWLIDPPRRRITFRQALAWLIFPVLYVI